jgi:hypothetical protein
MRMIMKKINVLLFEPGEAARVVEVENELRPLQKLIGGYMESVTLDNKAVLICNEDGKLLGLEPNRVMKKPFYDILHGTFFICGYKGDAFVSLPESDYAKHKEWFSPPSKV